MYHVTIQIDPMKPRNWNTIVKACAGKIDSLIELLQGKFSKAVMEIMTEPTHGLFPKPQEIEMLCSCPDSAGMCKHIAAVLYGVGSRLDLRPECLFRLRNVDHIDLLTAASSVGDFVASAPPGEHTLIESDLVDIFGIELAPAAEKKVTKKPKVERKTTARVKVRTIAKVKTVKPTLTK